MMVAGRALPDTSVNTTRARLGFHSKIAVLVPHFRCEQWLGECIASLVKQTRPPDAIIVIDDASAAPPIEIVAPFPSVSLFQSQENVGPYGLDSVGHRRDRFRRVHVSGFG